MYIIVLINQSLFVDVSTLYEKIKINKLNIIISIFQEEYFCVLDFDCAFKVNRQIWEKPLCYVFRKLNKFRCLINFLMEK